MKTKSIRLSGQSGFSLVELLVVIAVIAIIAAIAIPNISNITTQATESKNQRNAQNVASVAAAAKAAGAQANLGDKTTVIGMLSSGTVTADLGTQTLTFSISPMSPDEVTGAQGYLNNSGTSTMPVVYSSTLVSSGT